MQSPKRQIALIATVRSGLVWAQAQNQKAPTQTIVTLPPSILEQEITTIDHRYLKLSDYSDRTIVLNVFASWCGPCRVNLTDLIDLKRSYVAHPIEVIGLVSRKNDPDIDEVRKFVRNLGVNFQVVWDTENFADSLVRAVSGQSVVPVTYVIVRGKVRKSFSLFNPSMSAQLLRQTLDQIGQEPRQSP